MLQCVGHYQQVVDVGLDEASFSLSGRTEAVPLGPEQGLQEERVQQRAFGLALPDGAQHVEALRQPVRGDDAQPGVCVEDEQEVDDLRRHGEVAQDDVAGAVQGGVEGLAGVEGLPRWSCHYAINRGGPVLEPGRAPCCQSLTTPCRVSTFVMRWVRRPVGSFMSSWPRAMGR